MDCACPCWPSVDHIDTVTCQKVPLNKLRKRFVGRGARGEDQVNRGTHIVRLNPGLFNQLGLGRRKVIDAESFSVAFLATTITVSETSHVLYHDRADANEHYSLLRDYRPSLRIFPPRHVR